MPKQNDSTPQGWQFIADVAHRPFARKPSD